MKLERYTFPKPLHGSQEWLEVRWINPKGLSRISASVAAAVHGEHPYMTTVELAIELLRDEPPVPKPTNEAMDRGNRLEPVLLKWFSDLEDVEVTTPDVMYALDSGNNEVRLVATLDGITWEGIPVEIKTSRKMWDGVLPRAWYWQGVHQALCVGVNKVEWGIFDSNLELHRYTQRVSSDEIQIHVDACARFLESIDDGRVPPNAQMNYDNASALNPAVPGIKECPEILISLVESLEKARSLKSTAFDLEEEAKKGIALMLEGYEVGTVNGEKVVSWKTTKKSSFDLARFTTGHPSLVEKYTKQTEYRTIRTTKRR